MTLEEAKRQVALMPGHCVLERKGEYIIVPAYFKEFFSLHGNVKEIKDAEAE